MTKHLIVLFICAATHTASSAPLPHSGQYSGSITITQKLDESGLSVKSVFRVKARFNNDGTFRIIMPPTVNGAFTPEATLLAGFVDTGSHVRIGNTKYNDFSNPGSLPQGSAVTNGAALKMIVVSGSDVVDEQGVTNNEQKSYIISLSRTGP